MAANSFLLMKKLIKKKPAGMASNGHSLNWPPRH
jgi:hypothetical protein